jgi:sulfite exporter TauE/SafE
MAAAFLAAFFLGVAGSVHCVGMCGPLALGLPGCSGGRVSQLLQLLRYHAGRISTYAAAGLLFGWLGRRVWIAGWQQGFSIGLGVLILVFAVARHRLPAVYFGPLQRNIARIWQLSAGKGVFFLGMVNGLLPCGMVYLAIAGALTRPHIPESVAFMAFFGLGTLPLLLVLQWTGNMLPLPYRLRLRRALPFITVVVAVLLIVRGLNLGIPFVSPMLPSSPGHAVSCH